ncbi:type 1 glutamine amidotransferase family protein [Ideonella sp. BN130291]|uniref:type 1 glutamine amidotransferase family protein n=1 Tax=Ideonella sp. BN130291 TaxID=3112940 RepID=UPI002E262817|nr:type 1 glutamine amidotransferase family protein [Ideonella sp. BN130291]
MSASSASRASHAAPPVRTVHLYVFDGFADWEPAFAVAGIHSPAFQREPGRWRVRTVGDTTAAVQSMGGLQVQPHLALADLQPAHSAMLILPGGPGWDQGEHLAAARKGEQFLQAGVPVAAICGATAGLARLGVLDERRHTSNALAYLKGTHYGGSDRYEDEPAFNDGGLITAGGMAPLEFAREIFRALGIYSDEALEAWYALYRTGRSEHFARLQQSAAA